MNCNLYNDDCLEVLKTLPDDSVDAMITDPPAGISFMGKSWDSDRGGRDGWVRWLTQVMQECLRVLKPGAHALVWALPRTSYWTGNAIEDAGFEVRDVVTHLFGSGFPKSLNISKAIDKAAGAEREVIGSRITKDIRRNVAADIALGKTDRQGKFAPGSPSQMMEYNITAASTDAAKQWDGFGTALKPACEFWFLCRKPISEKTIAANVLKHGTGGLNIDESRIAGNDYTQEQWDQKGLARTTGRAYGIHKGSTTPLPTGRFPANLVLSHSDNCTEDQCELGCAVMELDEQSGQSKSISSLRGTTGRHDAGMTPEMERRKEYSNTVRGHSDAGGASRFFYCAKASAKDKGEGNTHPTVKSTKLMSYLIKLISPPNGTILDPFMGSGSTGVASLREGFDFIGIEKDLKYFRIAEMRINQPQGKNTKGNQMSKLDLGLLVGAESKEWLADFTKQLDRAEKLFGKSVPKLAAPSDDEEEVVAKPKRGRPAKQAQVEEAEESESLVEENDVDEYTEELEDVEETSEIDVAEIREPKKERPKKITKEDVNDAFMARAEKTSFNEAKLLLWDKFRVKSVTSLKESQFADAIKAAQSPVKK